MNRLYEREGLERLVRGQKGAGKSWFQSGNCGFGGPTIGKPNQVIE
jgi:hypothetical protein